MGMDIHDYKCAVRLMIVSKYGCVTLIKNIYFVDLKSFCYVLENIF